EAPAYIKRMWESEYSANIYATKLTVRDNPAMSFYTYLRYSGDWPTVDVTLYHHPRGTKEHLVQQFYTSATFFGEIDQEKFEELATDQYMLDNVMTYMNQKLVGASNEHEPEWFYDAFGVKDLEKS